MMKVCKNCGAHVNGTYCSHCGQKIALERISFHYISHEVTHFFTHFEKGFAFTSWNMLARPGKVVTEFVEGKRKRYQPPVSFFLIWITIYLLMLYIAEKIFGENVAIDYSNYFGPGATTKFAISHLSAILLVVLPFQALYFKWFVGQNKYNYFECFVVALYFLGTVILIQCVFVIIAVIVHLVSGISVPLIFSDPLKIIYLFWGITDAVRVFKLKNKFIRIVVFGVLAFGTFTVWRLYGVPGVAEWLIHR